MKFLKRFFWISQIWKFLPINRKEKPTRDLLGEKGIVTTKSEHSSIQADCDVSCKYLVESLAVMTSGSDVLVSGVLRKGIRPQKADTIHVVRTRAIGVIEDVSFLGEVPSWAKALSMNIVFAVSDETIQSSVGLRISGVAARDIQKGDEVVCYENKRETPSKSNW
jgi:hypothetical protein